MTHSGDRKMRDAAHRPRVMVVDDDADMRALLRDVLERDGFLVREHSTGNALMPALESWRPDAIVLDNVLEGPRGLDLLSPIRRHYPTTPVVLITAFGGIETEAAARRLGATHYLDKPFRVGRLLAVLRSALAHARHEADRRPPE